MPSVIEHQDDGPNYSVTSILRSLAHPVKSFGSGVNFVRNYFSGGAVADGQLLTEGGDSLITEDGRFLILE